MSSFSIKLLSSVKNPVSNVFKLFFLHSIFDLTNLGCQGGKLRILQNTKEHFHSLIFHGFLQESVKVNTIAIDIVN